MEGKVDDAKKRKLNQEEREQHAQRKKKSLITYMFYSTIIAAVFMFCTIDIWTFAV